jgi:AraC-like DNA-binding protein
MFSQIAPLAANPLFQARTIGGLLSAVEDRLGARFLSLPDFTDGASATANSCALPRSDLFFCDYGIPVRLKFADADYVRVQFRHDGAGLARFGRDRVEVTAVQGCISPAAAELDFGAGFKQVVWRIRSPQLTQALSSLIGAPATAALTFTPQLDLTSDRGKALHRLLDFVLCSLQDGTAHPVVLRELEQALVMAFLLAGRHSYSRQLDCAAPAPAPWQVTRAEAYIEAHWNQPISIEAIAATTGASARSIFRAFKLSRSCTPFEFVRRLRLQNARRMLEAGDPATRVTDIAIACAFNDLGHFSREFRRAFGLRPSDLLRGQAGRTGTPPSRGKS